MLEVKFSIQKELINISIGGISFSLGDINAIHASFELQDNYATSNLSGTITNSKMVEVTIRNGKLWNSLLVELQYH